MRGISPAPPAITSPNARQPNQHRVRDRAGAKELRLYDLRHAFGQWLVNVGVPQSVVRVGMRHKTAAMTARYVKQRDRGVNAAAMAGILFGAPETPAETPAAARGLKLAKGA